MVVKLIVSYDGTNYCGWQVQPNGITVQEELEKALFLIQKMLEKIYKLLDENERNSIAKILEIFDNKDVNDKFLLKNIIENEYVYSDTTVKAKTMIKSPDRVFAAAAKQQQRKNAINNFKNSFKY